MSLTIISRSGWEARPPKKPFTKLKRWRIKGIVLHHSGVKNGPTGVGAVKQYERFHMDSRGWNAIAYNWLVDEKGVVYEGRGPGIQSGATKGWNSRTESICYTGWGAAKVGNGALVSIKALVNDIQGRYDHGLWVKGHRDLGNSSCPGNWLYDWLRAGMSVDEGDWAQIDWASITAHLDKLKGVVSHSPLSVRHRSRGEAVRAVQERLTDLGYEAGGIDGIFGRNTAKAVKEFQKKFGFLKVDGVVGVQTWDVLFA